MQDSRPRQDAQGGRYLSESTQVIRLRMWHRPTYCDEYRASRRYCGCSPYHHTRCSRFPPVLCCADCADGLLEISCCSLERLVMTIIVVSTGGSGYGAITTGGQAYARQGYSQQTPAAGAKVRYLMLQHGLSHASAWVLFEEGLSRRSIWSRMVLLPSRAGPTLYVRVCGGGGGGGGDFPVAPQAV